MKTFLENLRKELKKQRLNDFEITDIINDHEEMISQAMEEGLTEDQIVEKFGDPKELAIELGKSASSFTDDESENTNNGDTIATFEKDDIKAVYFTLIHEDIFIEKSNNNQFEVIGDKINPKQYKVYEKGGSIYIEKKHSMEIKFRISRDNGQSFTLKVPSGYQLTFLDIKTKSSDIDIKHLNADSLNIKTISSDLKLSDCQILENNIKAISGDVLVQSSHFKSLAISNVSGDYDVKDTEIEETLTISSVSGDFIIHSSSAKDVVYRTVSGDMEGHDFYPESVTLKSISGDINIENSDKSKTIIIKGKKTLSGDIKI